MAFSIAATFAALIAAPIGLGAVLGVVLRLAHGRRFAGVVAAIALVGVPPAAATALASHVPVIGFWDALLEGLLVGLGLAWTAHRALARPGNALLAVGSLVVSLLLLEVACVTFLPEPPAFPTAGGPHFLLADAMRAATQTHSWDFRSKEIVCAAVYGAGYPGILDVGSEQDVVVPRAFTPRPSTTRRVLHIGDSMTFGIGLQRDETFTAELERLEPDTQHINGAVPGIAPDAYFLLLERWLATHPLDLAIMYVFEGNDLAGLDDDYPCCHWNSLLTYGPDGPQRRCPVAPPLDFAAAGATWLRYNSPPPYLLRALVGWSAAAAHAAAAIVNTMPNKPLLVRQSQETQLQHLGAILGAARDALRARGVPLVVVILPSRTRVANSASEQLAPAIIDVAPQLDLPVLDAGEALADPASSGRGVFMDAPGDPHYSAVGHTLIAAWLHQRLATFAARRPPP